LLDLEGERLREAIGQRAEYSEWRSTLSFAFSSLLAKNASPDRAGDEHKSITWLECERAVAEGREVLAFLVDERQP